MAQHLYIGGYMHASLPGMANAWAFHQDYPCRKKDSAMGNGGSVED